MIAAKQDSDKTKRPTRKDETSNSNSDFLGLQTEIRIVTKWHHMASLYLFVKMDLAYLLARVFLYFPKKQSGVSGGHKRRIGDELEVLKHRELCRWVSGRFL